MSSRGEQKRQPDQISTDGPVGASRRVTKGIPDPLDDIKGTPNQVIVTIEGTQIVLSLPQDIDVDADVVFDTLTIDKIIFNLSAALSPGEGELAWNADDGTLDLGMPGGNVTLQIGQELQTPRSTASGSDIDNGQLVYVSGAAGANPKMSLALADASSTASGTIAMATEDVIENQKGYFTAFGLVRDVNTAAYAEGEQLYLSPAIRGGYTNVKPPPPYFIVKIGVVMRSHATEGVIFVAITQRTNNFIHIRGLTAGSVPFADPYGFLTEDNNNLFWDSVNKRLGIGESTPLAHQQITSILTTNIGQIIKASEGQSANLLEFRNGSNNVEAVFDKSGQFGWGISTPEAKIDLRGILDPGISMRSVAGANIRFERAFRTNNAYLQFHTTDSNPNFPRWSFGLKNDGTDNFIIIDTHGNKALDIVDQGSNADVFLSSGQFVVKESGNVGIGTVIPDTKLHVEGDIRTGIDGDKYYSGGSKDMSMSYDGIAGEIKTNEADPSDLKIECGANKTLELINIVWDDDKFPASGVRLDSASTRYSYDFFNGGIQFDSDARYINELLSMLEQFPHKKKIDTVIRPHIHWMQTEANEPNWLLGYKKLSNGATITDETDFTNYTLLTKNANGFTYVSGNLIQITDFGDVSTSGMGVSDMIHWVLWRDTTNASGLFAGADPVNVGQTVFEFDVHFQIDTLGSRQEYIK